jgi:aspartyl protease family protein
MLRTYVIIVLAFVGIGAMVGRHLPPPSTNAEPQRVELVENDGWARIAQLKARNEPQFNNEDGSIELRRNEDGHFYADVRVNGANLHMLVDTGASVIALSRDDAQMAGLAPPIGMNDVVGRGADGAVHGELVHLDNVELGPLSAQRLDALVLNSGEQSLLGQSFLSKFSSIEIKGDTMVLR